MKAIKEFNGVLRVQVMQENPKTGDKTYYESRITGFRSLNLNILVGTIVKDLFSMHSARKYARAGAFSSRIPVVLRVMTDEGHTLLDTAKLDKTFTAKLTFMSEASFAKALFAALHWMQHRVEIAKATDIVKDKDVKFIENSNGNAILWEQVKKVAAEAIPAE